MNNQDPFAIVMQFFYRNSVPQPFMETGFGASGLGERRRADDGTGSFVANSQDNLAAALVCNGDAIFDQRIEMEAT